MHRILPEGGNNVVGICVEGMLTGEDYEELVAYLETVMETSGRIRLLCDMTEFRGVELEALWSDIKFSLRHLTDFERMAIVGNDRRVRWWARAVGPFVKTKVRCFRPGDIETAWRWLKS